MPPQQFCSFPSENCKMHFARRPGVRNASILFEFRIEQPDKGLHGVVLVVPLDDEFEGRIVAGPRVMMPIIDFPLMRSWSFSM
jgi:hypothetical protein